MNSIKYFFASLIFLTAVGFTASHANEQGYLPPIISILLDNPDNNTGPATINDTYGGNFIVSPFAF